VIGKVAIARERANPHPSVRKFSNLGKRKAIDIDQVHRLFYPTLHQIQ